MSIVDKLFDKSVPALDTAMDLYWKRGQAIASNISNTETPRYRAVDLSFAGELKEAFNQNKASLKLTDPRHMSLTKESSAHLVADQSGATKPDGNNVDLDLQMGKMAQNSGKYSVAAGLVRKKLHMMRMAIRFAMR